jgi:hypothetical protein
VKITTTGTLQYRRAATRQCEPVSPGFKAHNRTLSSVSEHAYKCPFCPNVEIPEQPTFSDRPKAHGQMLHGPIRRRKRKRNNSKEDGNMAGEDEDKIDEAREHDTEIEQQPHYGRRTELIVEATKHTRLIVLKDEESYRHSALPH